MAKKFYITAAIPYVNAAPHIGHALEFVQTDTIAKYHRLLGEDVIALSGGDRITLAPAGLAAENNHIHHYSRWNRICRPAVSLDGVGNRVAHNLIDNAPHQAISFGGNDHLIELNEIHSVCYESNDAGAIYSGRNWTMRGTVIRHNYFHHINGFEGRGCVGVYLDDSGISLSLFTPDIDESLDEQRQKAAFWQAPVGLRLGDGGRARPVRDRPVPRPRAPARPRDAGRRRRVVARGEPALHAARALGLAALPARAGLWVTGYYPGYRQGYLPPSAIDFAALTHIISTIKTYLPFRMKAVTN